MLNEIQLGYWIVEGLVDRKTEHYPRGGIRHLVGLDLKVSLVCC